MRAHPGRERAASPPPRAGLSVLITAKNEEEQLPHALASVRGWADEVVVVVDPASRDRTREVAAAAGARVLEHPFASSAEQCNWGLEQCAHPWVLVIDADERVTAPLKDAVDAALSRPRYAAYAVRRANLALGRRLRFGDWGHDNIVRLLDRASARFSERAVHGAVLAPSVGRLAGTLEHHTFRSLEQYLPKVADYARRGGRELAARGVTSGPLRAFGHAAWRLLRAYVMRMGCLDGMPGLVVAVTSAWGTFLKWATVWEQTARRRRA